MMAEIMVDSNVLLDVLTEDPHWFGWSIAAIEEHAEDNTLVINAVIYAEVSIAFDRMEDLQEALPPGLVIDRPIPLEAAFLAGKCFAMYRRRGGTKTAPLPDFFIGAHAAVGGMSLITRDAPRYRTYFPSLKLICPAGLT